MSSAADVLTRGAEESEVAARSPFGVLFRVAAGWLAMISLAAIFASLLPLPKPEAVDVFVRLKPVGTPGHLLGTDELGRDLLSRIVFGARVSLGVGVSAAALGAMAGGAIGLAAGYMRGRTDGIITGGLNVILGLPGLVLLISFIGVFRQRFNPVFVVAAGLAFLTIPIYARLTRGQTLSLSQREFVLAARGLRARRTRIMIREIMPNLLPIVIAFALIGVGLNIIAEGSLSYLGLSAQPPTPTWGGTIAAGKGHLQMSPHYALVPSVVMALTVLALNFVGDTLRRRLDVREAVL